VVEILIFVLFGSCVAVHGKMVVEKEDVELGKRSPDLCYVN
jgi:hypothetical protein